jgi:hypothetical protein
LTVRRVLLALTSVFLSSAAAARAEEINLIFATGSPAGSAVSE